MKAPLGLYEEEPKMKTYSVEQSGVGKLNVRVVEADGYAWSQGGIVSFQRYKDAEKPADADGSVREMETFATLYNVTAVFEDGTVR